MENLIKQVTKDNKAVKILEEIKGISIITASKMIAEIINIKRFLKNDNLASYAGLCLKENKTGESEKMKYSKMFNHRLKDTFIVAAKNFVMFNPDSHLSGYYRNLIKSRVKKTEVSKRVARALVRVIFRKLNAISINISPNIQQDRSENEMASGSSREDHNNPGNISFSTPLDMQANIDYKGKEINSLNFDEIKWIVHEGKEIVDPYKLLPPVFPDLNKEEVDSFMMDPDLRDGGAAMIAFAKLQYTEMTDREREYVVKALLKYCELNTLAMVMIYEAWKELI